MKLEIKYSNKNGEKNTNVETKQSADKPMGQRGYHRGSQKNMLSQNGKYKQFSKIYSR